MAYSYSERYKNDPEFRERVKTARKARYHAAREAEKERSKAYRQANLDQVREKARERACKRRRAAGVLPVQSRVQTVGSAPTRAKKPKLPRVVKSKPQVPQHVKVAWRRAHKNSSIRRVYPTQESLTKGDWSKEQQDRWVTLAERERSA